MAKQRITLQEPTLSMDYLIAEYVMDMKSRGLTEKSIANGEKSLGKFFIKDGYDMEHLKELYASINSNEKWSITTKGTYLRFIRTFVNWTNRTYDKNYLIPKIPSEEVIKETYTDEELKKLIEKPKKWKSFCEYRNWLIILTLIDTGIRAATLRSITVDDVDIENRVMTSKHWKTKKQQYIPISKTLADEYRKYIPLVKGNVYLFCDVYGEQLSDGGLKNAVKRYNKSRGVERTSIHAFRHTFAKRYILDMHGDAFMLQKLLGHSTLAMTKHYCNIYDTEMLKVYDETSPLESLQRHKKQL